MGQQHKQRSVLSGRHPLQRSAQTTHRSAGHAQSALQILRDALAPQQRVHADGASVPPTAASAAAAEQAALSRAMVESSTPGTVIVPRRGGPHRLPYHIMGQPGSHPWELLPMRAAALKEYPGLFTEACLFFSSLQLAVYRNEPQRLLRCTKASLDLAKLLRNLGVLAGFEVVQNLRRCKAQDPAWPAGVEPHSYSELDLYPYLYIKVNLRWDAYKPLWRPPSLSVLQEQLHPTDALPLAVRHLSKPSMPTLMWPKDFWEAAKRLPAGVGIMYHHQLGLTTDAVVTQYQVPALALTHLALPWVQVAQIKAAVRDKVEAERGKGLPLSQTRRLTEWRVSDWVETALAQRQAQVVALAAETRRQEQGISSQVAALNQQDTDKARQGLMVGQQLHNELVSLQLLDKLREASAALLQQEQQQQRPTDPGSPASQPSPSSLPSAPVVAAQPPGASPDRADASHNRLFRGWPPTTPTTYGSLLPAVGPSQGRHAQQQQQQQQQRPLPPGPGGASARAPQQQQQRQQQHGRAAAARPRAAAPASKPPEDGSSAGGKP